MLCPHQLSFADGRVTKVTLDMLKRTMKRMNSRTKLYNQFSTASEDHIVTLDAKGNPVTKRSRDINLLGYQANYDIVKDGGVDWLVGDVYVAPDKYETAKGLPFTSVEYHPDDDLISNIAFTKHRPQLDVGTITPYHWERGTVENTGYAGNRLVAYSVEGKPGGIVIYSTERNTMAPLTDFISGMKGLLATLEASETEVAPPATPAAVVPATPAKVLPYSGSAMGATTTLTAEQELRQLKRRSKLVELSKTKNLNVEEEMKGWGGDDTDDLTFDKHLACATACYSAVSSGGARVTPLDPPGGALPGGADIELRNRAAKVMSKIAERGGHTNIVAVMDHLKADPNWDGN